MTPATQQRRAVAALHARMDELGLTARQLAHQADLSYSTVRDTLHGRHKPRRDTINRIAHALGWPPTHLAAITDTGRPPLADYTTAELAAELCRRLDQ